MRKATKLIEEKASMIKRLEEKYGIHIADDSFYSPLTGKFYKRYRIYTVDGCQWENGLTFRGLQAECKKYSDTFKKIASAT
jgi:hypothetical protein